MTNQKYLLFLLCALFSCKALQNNSTENISLIDIDGTSVPADEFVYVYTKNNFLSDTVFNQEDVKEYLELYINFKLKVKEAEEEGLHETEAFKEELEGYRKQLAKPYLTESGVTDDLVEEAYERLKTEVNAAHILISLSSDASPEDTLKVYNKLMAIRERAIAGENFGDLAAAYSEDPSASTNQGDLGYFTALQMVYPFEDAAYKTEAGQISYPVRTRFGYHLIYVKDKRPSQGKVKVSHIMVRATQGISKADSIAARNEIYEIYNQLENGADWFEMANQYSDDISSKSSGGALPWFGTGNMIPEFEEVAFSLEEKGEISEPLKTVYGWHIIKLDEKQGIEPFEELEPSLRSKVTKDSRGELNKIALIKRLKEENNFKEYEEVVESATTEIDSSLMLGKWSYSSENQLLGDALFSIGEKKYPVQDFYDYISDKQRQQENMTVSQYVDMLYDQYRDAMLIAYEEMHLPEKHEGYRMLLKEYRDGILLFELMDKKVWSKAVEDTVGLKKFFEENKENYQWEERVQATIFTSSSPQVIDSLETLLQQPYYPTGKRFSLATEDGSATISDENKKVLDSLASMLLEDTLKKVELYYASKENTTDFRENVKAFLKEKGIEEQNIITGETSPAYEQEIVLNVVSTSEKVLEKRFNETNALNLQVAEGKYEIDELPLLSQVEWQQGHHRLQYEGREVYVVIKQVLPPSQKEFEEIRGQVISDYQNHLEAQWVDDLRNRYTVEVNEEALEKVLEQLENK